MPTSDIGEWWRNKIEVLIGQPLFAGDWSGIGGLKRGPCCKSLVGVVVPDEVDWSRLVINRFIIPGTHTCVI